MLKQLMRFSCFAVVLSLLSTQTVLGSLVIERRIATGSDDVEENVGTGQIDVGSSDLEMLNDGGVQTIGLRFIDLDIPNDAIILEAWIQFEVDETKSATLPVNLIIEGELKPNPVTFSEDLRNVTDRSRTEAQVRWDVPDWPEVGVQGPDQASADITVLIDELIAQDGWQPGNAMVFIISDDQDNPSQGIRTAESYSNPTGKPMLHIRIFGETATDPVPANGTQNVTPVVLEWAAGDTATSHTVYFGINPVPGANEFQGSQEDPLFLLPLLTPGTTYYWRVDEVSDDGTVHMGDVWSFSTVALAPHTPSPATGAQWIDIDANLSWAAGRDTVLYDLYFGTDANAVTHGTGGTHKGQLIVTTFDLSTLEKDTVYYWRLDGYESDGVTKHAGPIWQFTTAGQEGGLKAEYYTYDIGAPPTPASKAFDPQKLVITRIDPQVNSNFESDPVNNLGVDSFAIKWTGELDVAFTEPYTFVTNTDDGLKLWVNGQPLISNWTNHGDTVDSSQPINLVAGQRYTLELWYFENTSGAIVQLYWESPSTPRQLIPSGALSLPRMARRPLPSNTLESVTQEPTLSWTAGDKADKHDIFFGDDAEALANADTTTVGIYTGRQDLEGKLYYPGPLEWNKTYYWRVDEVNELDTDSPWTGEVWSFATADFLIVDDFELYTDDVNGRIFQSWIDGWGYATPEPGDPGNGTGSIVGYLDPPFAEHVFVNSGNQSLPMEYANSEAPYYSETIRTWETPQDWTVNGVNTLVLSLRGSASNSQEPFYVGIEDRDGNLAVVVSPNPDAVMSPLWAEWKVSISAFSDAGADVTAVKKMYIGVGDRANPAQAGQGMLFVDDINVIKSE